VETNNPNQSTLSPEEARQSCCGSLHPSAIAGIDLYNRKEYFEAHEELEIAWRDETGPIRDLYHGILQVGLGYYHIMRGNYKGAVKMFQRCSRWLDPFPEECRGVNVDQLKQDYRRVEELLLRLGPTGMQHIDPNLFKPVPFITSPTKE
jgi:uncharacterized protein